MSAAATPRPLELALNNPGATVVTFNEPVATTLLLIVTVTMALPVAVPGGT